MSKYLYLEAQRFKAQLTI